MNAAEIKPPKPPMPEPKAPAESLLQAAAQEAAKAEQAQKAAEAQKRENARRLRVKQDRQAEVQQKREAIQGNVDSVLAQAVNPETLSDTAIRAIAGAIGEKPPETQMGLSTAIAHRVYEDVYNGDPENAPEAIKLLTEFSGAYDAADGQSDALWQTALQIQQEVNLSDRQIAQIAQEVAYDLKTRAVEGKSFENAKITDPEAAVKTVPTEQSFITHTDAAVEKMVNTLNATEPETIISEYYAEKQKPIELGSPLDVVAEAPVETQTPAKVARMVEEPPQEHVEPTGEFVYEAQSERNKVKSEAKGVIAEEGVVFVGEAGVSESQRKTQEQQSARVAAENIRERLGAEATDYLKAVKDHDEQKLLEITAKKHEQIEHMHDKADQAEARRQERLLQLDTIALVDPSAAREVQQAKALFDEFDTKLVPGSTENSIKKAVAQENEANAGQGIAGVISKLDSKLAQKPENADVLATPQLIIHAAAAEQMDPANKRHVHEAVNSVLNTKLSPEDRATKVKGHMDAVLGDLDEGKRGLRQYKDPMEMEVRKDAERVLKVDVVPEHVSAEAEAGGAPSDDIKEEVRKAEKATRNEQIMHMVNIALIDHQGDRAIHDKKREGVSVVVGKLGEGFCDQFEAEINKVSAGINLDQDVILAKRALFGKVAEFRGAPANACREIYLTQLLKDISPDSRFDGVRELVHEQLQVIKIVSAVHDVITTEMGDDYRKAINALESLGNILEASQNNPPINGFTTDERDKFKDMLDAVKARFGHVIKEGQARFETYSSLQLSTEESRLLIENPIKLVDDLLSQAELGTTFAESALSQETLQRLRLVLGQFSGNARSMERVDLSSGGTFIEGIEAYLKSARLDNPQGRAEFRKDYKDLAFILSQMVDIRQDASTANTFIEGVGDLQRAEGAVQKLGDTGINQLLMQKGGLVGVAQRILFDELRLASKSALDQKTRLTSEVIKQAYNRAQKRLETEMTLHKDKYKNAYSYGKVGQPDAEFSGKDVPSIMKLADWYLNITQRKIVAMEFGAAPAASTDNSSFEAVGVWERYLKNRNWLLWNIDRWGSAQELQRVWIDNACYMSAQVTGRVHAVKLEIRKIKGMKDRDAQYRAKVELARKIFGGTNDASAQVDKSKAFGINTFTLKNFLSLERAHRMNAGSALFGAIPEHLPDDAKLLDYLNWDRLEYAYTIFEGRKDVNRMLNMYDNFSSGWRNPIYLRFIERRCKERVGDKMVFWGKNLALGIKLKMAANSVLEADNHHEKESALKKLFGALTNVGAYRPQELLKYQFEMGDEHARAWLKAQYDGGHLSFMGDLARESGGIYEQPLERFINTRFLAINDLLIDSKQGVIDYHAGPNERQLSVVRRVFAAYNKEANDQQLTAEVNGYLRFMKDLSGYYVQPSGVDADGDPKYTHTAAIKRFGDPKYREYWYTSNWTDDVPIELLEGHMNLPGDMASGTSLSDEFGRYGKDSSITRLWRDFALCEQTADGMLGLLSMHEKEHYEAVMKMYKNVSSWAGSKPWAARATILMMASRLKTFKPEWYTDLIFMSDSLARSTQAGRVLGHHVNAMSPNEIVLEMHKMGEALGVNLHRLSHEHYDFFLQFVGAKFGVNIPVSGKDGKAFIRMNLPDPISGVLTPVNVHRAEIAMLIFLGVMFVNSMKNATESLKEAS